MDLERQGKASKLYVWDTLLVCLLTLKKHTEELLEREDYSLSVRVLVLKHQSYACHCYMDLQEIRQESPTWWT